MSTNTIRLHRVLRATPEKPRFRTDSGSRAVVAKAFWAVPGSRA